MYVYYFLSCILQHVLLTSTRTVLAMVTVLYVQRTVTLEAAQAQSVVPVNQAMRGWRELVWLRDVQV